MRLALVTVSLLAGGAVTAAIYWAFLSTPESTVWALMLSAALALLALGMLSLTINAAIIQWARGFSVAAVKAAVARVPSIVPAAVVVGVFWWMAGRLDTWGALRSGEISAWFIARFGWDDMSWLFTGIRVFTTWLRWVVAGLLAFSLMAGIASIGWSAVIRPVWIRRGLRPRALVGATVWFVVLIVMPWVYLVPWRPAWMPATSAEMAFIAAKLSLTAILMASGVALIIYEAVRVPLPPTDPQSQQLAA